MLSEPQQDNLLVALFATAEVMGLQLSRSAALMMVQDLADFTEPVLTAALQACRRQGGRLTVDAIMKHAEVADGRPEANEAWAIALQSFDEASSVLMTEEIQQAAAIAAPVFHAARDKIGARMTFLSAYARLVTASRAAAQPVSWNLSLGHDQQGRETAIREGLRLGRISEDAASRFLESHSVARITHDGQAIAGLITGNGVAPSPELQSKWQSVKQSLLASKRRKEVQARWDHRKRLRAESARTAELMRQVAELQAAGGNHG